jgi:hypothetical protein
LKNQILDELKGGRNARKRSQPGAGLEKLRQVEVAVAGGKGVGQAVHGIGVTDTLITGGDVSTSDSISTRQNG